MNKKEVLIIIIVGIAVFLFSLVSTFVISKAIQKLDRNGVEYVNEK